MACKAHYCGFTTLLVLMLSGSVASQLFKDMKLEVLYTDPSEISEATSTVQLSGSQSLTAVFSRPVVSLGSDFGIEQLPNDKVPFSFADDIPFVARWVQSYVYRLDPIEQYPQDLQTQLVWNKNLTTWDGIKLEATELGTVSVITESIDMFKEEITSDAALIATDGRWPLLGEELLPGGKMSVAFSGDVQLTLMKDAFVLYEGSNVVTDNEILVFSCFANESLVDLDGNPLKDNCIKVGFAEPLQQLDFTYSLEFSEGAKYNEINGLSILNLDSDRFDFPGPRSNYIEFSSSSSGLSYQRMRFQLPRGLKEGTDLSQLKNAITIFIREWDEDLFQWNLTQDTLEFELVQLDNALFEMRAELEPDGGYLISVSGKAGVVDFFNVPLDSSAFNISMRSVQTKPEFEEPQTIGDSVERVVFDAYDGPPSWSIITRLNGNTDWDENDLQKLNFFAVEAQLSSIDFMDYVLRCVDDFFPSSYYVEFDRDDAICSRLDFFIGEVVASISATGSEELTIGIVDLSAAFNESGIVLKQKCCKDGQFADDDAKVPQGVGMMQSTYIYGVVTYMEKTTSPCFTRQCDTIFVWVNDLANGPAEGANVQIIDGDVKVVQEGTTDANGLVMFQVSNRKGVYYEIRALVTYKGFKNVFKTLRTPNDFRGEEPELIGRLVLDHTLIRPEETVLLKGYLRYRSGLDVTVPLENPNLYLEVSSSLNGIGDINITNYDPEFGTFEANITAVPDLPLRNYFVILRQRETGIELDEVKIVAADPRAPTVFLNVRSPFFVRPNATASVIITVGSLIGAKLENETITVRWQPGDEDRIERTVLSDEDGVAVAEFDLEVNAPTLGVGDTLQVEVEYIGPTRECLTDQKTIQVRNSQYELSILRSLETDIPGVEFGVVPLLISAAPNSEAAPQQAEINLQDSLGELVSSCSMMSNLIDFTQCRFQLPDMGKYKIIATVQDEQIDETVEVLIEEELGRSEEEWSDNPRSSYGIELKAFSDMQGEYAPEQTATIYLDIPFETSSVLMIVGSSVGNESRVLTMEQGVNEVEVSTGGVCRLGGCVVYFWVFAPRNSYVGEGDVVPSSIVFDVADAFHDFASVTIEVNNDAVLIDLDMSLRSLKSNISSTQTADFLVVQPLEEVQIEVLSDGALTESGIDTEVTIFIVDRSILDVVPTPFVDIVSPFEVSAIGRYEMLDWLDFGPGFKASALPIIMETAVRRQGLDPFLILSDMLRAYASDEPIPADISDEAYLSEFYIALTRQIARSRVPNVTVDFDELAIFSLNAADQMMELPAEQEAKLEELSEGLIRKVMRFAATPVYGVLRTEEDGRAVLAFTAPVALSRYNVRAYATGARDVVRFGKTELDFIVRRPVSTTAAVPRQVRTSDEFEVGVIITISPDDGLFQVGQIVSINLSVNITNPEDETAFFIDPEGTTVQVGVTVGDPLEVRFPMKAEVVGDVKLEFIASDPNTGASDWSRVTIPINGPALPVTLLDSISLDAQPDAEFSEAIQLQEAVPGSGTINMTIGLGRLPVIQSFASTILKIMQQENPQNPYALTALATVVVSDIIEGLGISRDSDSPLGNLLSALFPFYDSSLNKLEQGRLTTFSNGLRYYIPRNSYRGVNEFLNTWALTVVGDMKRAANTVPFRLQEASSVWSSALQQSVEDDVENFRSRFFSNIFPINRVADIRYALGADWNPQFDNEDQEYDVSVQRLAREFNNLNFDGKLSFALMLVGSNLTSSTLFNQTTGQDIVDEVVSDVQSSIRFRRSMAFVAYSPSSQSPARGLIQSKAIQLLLRTGNGIETIVPSMINYVTSQPIRFPAFDVPCLNTLLAVFEYELSQDNASPDVDFQARSGGTILLDAVFNSIEDPTVNRVTSFDLLDTPPEPVELLVQGSGEVGLSTILNFVPTTSFPFPQFRGLLVQRVIRLVDVNGRGTGKPLVKVPLSTVVSIELQIMTPEDLGGVEVLVPMPGGLEPVDPNVPSCSPGGNAVCYLGGFFEGRSSNRFRFGFTCPTMETRTNVVSFRYFYMNSGTSDISFKAIAATEGTFVLPSAQAASVEDPSISGLSAGGTFIVCDGEGCEPEFEGEEEVPKSCPNDCSNVGICDITTGECICDIGYEGEDCSEVVSE